VIVSHQVHSSCLVSGFSKLDFIILLRMFLFSAIVMFEYKLEISSEANLWLGFSGVFSKLELTVWYSLY
jgi:hypothetical protein